MELLPLFRGLYGRGEGAGFAAGGVAWNGTGSEEGEVLEDPFREGEPPSGEEVVVLHEEAGLKVVLARGGEVARAVEEALGTGGPPPPGVPVGYLVGEQVVVAQGLALAQAGQGGGPPLPAGAPGGGPGVPGGREEEGEEAPAPEEVRLPGGGGVRAFKRLCGRALSRLKRERDPERARELLERVRQARALLEG